MDLRQMKSFAVFKLLADRNQKKTLAQAFAQAFS
jgi:hypothetical protein